MEDFAGLRHHTLDPAELISRGDTDLDHVRGSRAQVLGDALNWSNQLPGLVHEAFDLFGMTLRYEINRNKYSRLGHYSDRGQGNKERE